MKNRVWVLVAFGVLFLAAACGSSGATPTTAPPTQAPTEMPQPTDTVQPAATPAPATAGLTPACPPADGEGTVSPAVSIDSIVFLVNGVEQVVRDGDALQALPGDQVQVAEVTVCVGPFSGNGGEACVDFAPAEQDGQEIASEHRGTHTVRVSPGFMSIAWSSEPWTVEENWKHIAGVLNHWPPDGTADLACGSGRCERDDRIIVAFR